MSGEPAIVSATCWHPKRGDALLLQLDRTIGGQQAETLIDGVKALLPDGVAVLVIQPGVEFAIACARETQYARRRAEILDAFWSDMSSRLGLQEPVKESMDATRVALNQAFVEAFDWLEARPSEPEPPADGGGAS